MKTYARYKDSGISWIGKIPERWDVNYLFQRASSHYISNKDVHHQNLLSLSYGRIIQKDINKTDGLLPASFDTYQIVENGNIVLRLTDLQNDHKSLRVGYVTQEGIITSAYECLCVAHHSMFAKYLYYQLHVFDLKKMFYGMGGGLRQNLNYDELKKIRIIAPPIEEQKAIVAYLDKKTEQINHLVAAYQKQIELLKEYKQSLIANAVTKGINPKVKLKDSGISWIGKAPEHWEIKRIASFFDENKEVNKEFEYKHAYQFKYGTLVPKNETGNEKEYEETYVKYTILNRNDIVFNGLNLNYDFISQRVAICPEKGIITSAYIAITPRNTIDPMFYCWLFKTMDNKKMFHGMGSGIRLTLSYAELKSQLIPFPPIDEQKQIVAYINERVSFIDSQISSIEKQIANLNEYKQSLISDVVTGKVKV